MCVCKEKRKFLTSCYILSRDYFLLQTGGLFGSSTTSTSGGLFGTSTSGFGATSTGGFGGGGVSILMCTGLCVYNIWGREKHFLFLALRSFFIESGQTKYQCD